MGFKFNELESTFSSSNRSLELGRFWMAVILPSSLPHLVPASILSFFLFLHACWATSYLDNSSILVMPLGWFHCSCQMLVQSIFFLCMVWNRLSNSSQEINHVSGCSFNHNFFSSLVTLCLASFSLSLPEKAGTKL